MERRRPRKQRKSGGVSGRGRGRLWSVGPRRQREGGATQSGQVGRGVSGGAHELQAELRDAGERCGLSAFARCGPKRSRPGRALCGLLRERERGAGRAGVLAGPSRVGPSQVWAGFWIPFLFLFYFLFSPISTSNKV